MDKYIFVYKGEHEPDSKEVIWIHHKIHNNINSPYVAEIWIRGSWTPISSGGSDGGSIDEDIIDRFISIENRLSTDELRINSLSMIVSNLVDRLSRMEDRAVYWYDPNIT